MDDKIVNCPVCKGWGFNQLPLASDTSPCSYCSGKAVQVKNKDFFISWDIPSYIDFGKRRTNKTRSAMLLAGLLIALIIIVLVLTLIFRSI